MGEAIVETRGVESAYQTLVKFGASGPRIHIFWRGDGDPDCHDHPADFWTFPLVSYVEEFISASGARGDRVVKAFRLHRRRAEFAHILLGSYEGLSFDRTRLLYGRRPVVTLVWWGKKRREWGFHTLGGWVPWREYIDRAQSRSHSASERGSEATKCSAPRDAIPPNPQPNRPQGGGDILPESPGGRCSADAERTAGLDTVNTGKES